MLSRLTMLLLALAMIPAFSACDDGAGGGGTVAPPADDSPSGALRKVIFAAQSKDVAAFKAGLSKNFVLSLDEYEKLGQFEPELKGAFTIETFMNSIASDPPTPKQEIMKDMTHAEIKAETKDGKPVTTKMVKEDGVWKLEVPERIAYLISHPDELKAIATNKPLEDKPDLPTGGGGKAGRFKSLPPDASDADKAKATALDAFDLGAMSTIEEKLNAALKLNPDDEELVVALGRAQVQKGDHDGAVKTLEGHVKKFPKAVRAHHYLGMGYLMKQRYDDAAKSWRTIMQLDPQYAAEFKLERRAKVAEAMAKGEDLSKFGLQGQPGKAAPPPAKK